MPRDDEERDEYAEERMATARLGSDAEEFLVSDLGKYLLGCADQEVEEGVEALKAADPVDANAIREAQNRVWRGQSIKEWLAEIVQQGRVAYMQLRDEDEQPYTD